MTLKLRAPAGALLLSDCLLNTVWCLSTSPSWMKNAALVGNIASLEIIEEKIVRVDNRAGEANPVSNIAGKFGKKRTLKTEQGRQ